MDGRRISSFPVQIIDIIYLATSKSKGGKLATTPRTIDKTVLYTDVNKIASLRLIPSSNLKYFWCFGISSHAGDPYNMTDTATLAINFLLLAVGPPIFDMILDREFIIPCILLAVFFTWPVILKSMYTPKYLIMLLLCAILSQSLTSIPIDYPVPFFCPPVERLRFWLPPSSSASLRIPI